MDLLDASEEQGHSIDYEELEENKQILLDKLATYNIDIIAIDAVVGPTVTLYELTPAPGVKISRITSLENDLAMALAAARGIRMIAPIPGKSAIGVEIPNRHREFVRTRDIIETRTFQETRMELPLILGKSIEGETMLQDLTKMPHVLIAGATGSGKSVGVNTYCPCCTQCLRRCWEFVMIDPKKIELAAYARIASHYVAMPPEADDAIITDVSQALGTLKSCEKEMESRYDLLAKAQVRSIREYNKRFKDGGLDPDEEHRLLPYIIVVVDELADLMMTAGKDIEGPIARLAQMARAVGIHLILATQRPSVDVITDSSKPTFRPASPIRSPPRSIPYHSGPERCTGSGRQRRSPLHAGVKDCPAARTVCVKRRDRSRHRIHRRSGRSGALSPAFHRRRVLDQPLLQVVAAVPVTNSLKTQPASLSEHNRAPGFLASAQTFSRIFPGSPHR